MNKVAKLTVGALGLSAVGVGVANADTIKDASEKVLQQALGHQEPQKESEIKVEAADNSKKNAKILKLDAQKVKPIETTNVQVVESIADSNADDSSTYTVKSGDTLSDIALANGVSVDDLIANNGGSDLLSVGQVINLSNNQSQPNDSSANATPSAPSINQESSDAAVENSTPQPSVQNDNKEVDSSTPQTQTVTDQTANQNNQSNGTQTTTDVKPPVATPSTDDKANQSTGSTDQSANTSSDAQVPDNANNSANQQSTDGTPKDNDSNAKDNSQYAAQIINLANQLASQGIPYLWGGSTVNGFDCSGLTSYVYQQVEGVSLPHNTILQEGYVATKKVSEARVGDLLFWGNRGATYHVAIYLGNNQYLTAPEPGKNVQIEKISSSFMPSFAGSVK